MHGRVRIRHNQVGIAIVIEVVAGDIDCAPADREIIAHSERAIATINEDSHVFTLEIRGYNVVRAIVIKVPHRCRVHTFTTWVSSCGDEEAGSVCGRD
jgi:hypothetical protein